MTENKDVWVVAEHSAGKLEDVTLEMIGEGHGLARKLGERICVLIMGYQITAPLQVLANNGVHRLYLADHPLLADYTTDAYTVVLVNLIKQYRPSLVIFGATANGSDLAPRVAARLQIGLVSGCTALKINDQGVLEATRPVYEDKIYSTVVFQTNSLPRMFTVKPGAIGIGKVEPVEETEVKEAQPLVTSEDIKTKVVGYIQADAKSLSLNEADIIVAGGHGVEDASNWHLIEELADVLGGAIAGSRMATDAGWVTTDRLVGQSGKTVKSTLYVAAGISGVSHHTEGMKGSEHIIVINKDAAAPIFKLANLSILGDLTEVMPLLIEKVRQLKQSANEKLT